MEEDLNSCYRLDVLLRVQLVRTKHSFDACVSLDDNVNEYIAF